jgi:phosphoglycolate phosphatase
MQTGNAAGMDTVGVTWGFRTREELGSFGAKWIIDSPGQLLEILDD